MNGAWLLKDGFHPGILACPGRFHLGILTSPGLFSCKDSDVSRMCMFFHARILVSTRFLAKGPDVSGVVSIQGYWCFRFLITWISRYCAKKSSYLLSHNSLWHSCTGSLGNIIKPRSLSFSSIPYSPLCFTYMKTLKHSALKHNVRNVVSMFNIWTSNNMR